MSVRNKMREIAASGNAADVATITEIGKGSRAQYNRAAEEVAHSPVAQEWVKRLGIHPDRAVQYGQALLDHKSGRGPEPDPKQFKTPVVRVLQPKGMA